jgi:hypothetical protein
MVVEALAEVHSPSWEEQRHESLRNLRDLTPAQLVEGSIPPVELSVLGLVRHMTEMEHVFLSWGLAGGEQRLRYGDEGLRRRLGRDERGPALVLRGKWERWTPPSQRSSHSTLRARGTANLCDPASWR